MTREEREEAKKIMENEVRCVRNPNCERLECRNCYLVMPEHTVLKAYEVAIKALEQEPCGDCISRVEAMRAITDEWGHTYGNHTLEGFTDALYNLPPVIPEQPVMTGEFITGSFTGEEPTGEWVTTTAQAESEEEG
jgi:hypothetical protein